MNPLQHRLDSLRRRLILVAFWRGAAGLFALVVGAALVACLADWQAHLPSALRALALVGTLAAAGYVGVRFVIVPLARRSDNLSLALRIEEVYPELNDLLGSSVQFLEQPAEELQGSKSLRQRAVEQAEKRAENCDFNNIVDRRGIFLLPVAALIAGLGAAHFVYHYPELSMTALCRLADPFGNHTWTQIDIGSPPSRIARGQMFIINGKVTGVMPAQAKLEVEGVVRVDLTLPIKQETGEFITHLYKTQERLGKFRFRITANDASFPARGGWHEIQVMAPPDLVPLDGLPSPQIELDYPEYTDLPSPKKLSAGQGHIDAVAGTEVHWRAAVDRPVSEAWVELQTENRMHKLALQLNPILQMQPLDFLASAMLAQTVVGRNPCQIDADGTLLSTRFTGWLPGSYRVHFEDTDGLGGDFERDLRIFSDPPPVVQLRKPGTSQSLLPDAAVTLQMIVDDEIFAVRSIFLEYRRKGPDGVWLDAEPQRLPIVDAEFMSLQTPLFGSPAHLRLKQLELESRWPLRKQFKEGETVVFRIGADDFNNLFTPRAVGYSHDVELRIVGDKELARQLNEDFHKVQEDIVRLQNLQDKAIKKIEEVQDDRKKDPKAPLDKTQHDLVVEAEQLQKQIQERIGQKKDEGLRDELQKIKQKMIDNQLPNSDLKDRINTLTNELDRLVQEDLQQIEAKLAEARSQPAGAPKPMPPTPQKKDPLDQAKALQQDAKKTLDELAKFLDPWASLQQIKGDTAKLLAEQKELKKDTEAMPKGDRDDARKKAEQENRLAKKAESLLGTMKEVKDKQEGSDTAKKLAEALDIAKKADLTNKMTEIRDTLKNEPQPGVVSQKQQDVIETLEKMVAAMEKQQRDEELDAMRKKQKKAEKKLDALAKEMNQLQKKIAAANKIADPEERAEELKKLAKQEEKLKEKLQEEARELAQLRAEKAGRDLSKAAQELEQAGKKMQAGEDPGEALQEAQAKIKQAQADLEEAEEELAREQLARVADRIKGLKERQDGVLTESERLQKELDRNKKWLNDRLTSLKQNSVSQKNLIQEADSLQEKLAGAKVFEHIIKKAGQSMTKAAEAIRERADKVVEARKVNGEDVMLEPEELAAEKMAHDNIVKLQKDASQRLQRLLDALKDDPKEKVAQKPMEEPKKGEDPKDPMGEEKPPQPKAIPADGIPPMAQIKALIAEQEEVKQNTKAFDERNPDRDNLNVEQQAELRALEADQLRIRELFEALTKKAADNEKGEEP